MNYSPIRNIVPSLENAKNKNLNVYEMHIGQPNIKTPDAFFDGINNYKEKIIKYENSAGSHATIKAFCQMYKNAKIDLTEDEILITHGGSEAIMFAIQTICDPGDEVIIFEPFYSNYDSFIKCASVKPCPIRLDANNDYKIPPYKTLQKAITNKTKAILLSNPNNPLGTILSKDEMHTIAQLAIEYDLFIITDEVYRQFVYDNCYYESFMNIDGLTDRCVLVDSISKHYSACGARIGVLATKNKEFYSQALKLCQARLSVSTIEQIASANLIYTMDSYADNVRGEYMRRRDVFCTELSKIDGVDFVFPKSAFYVFATLPVDDTQSFVRFLLEDFEHNGETLSFAPGAGFYINADIKNAARFSFCANACDELKTAAKLLKIGINEYKK
jgi:aspartate aminotransferase